MKLKYYLRGIGIGMIVTTIILMIAFAVHKEQPLTDDEIRARALELGMVMAEDIPAGDKLSDSNKEIDQTDGEQSTPVDASDKETSAPEEDVAGAAKDKKTEGTKEVSDKGKDDQKTTTSDKTDQDEPETEVIEQVEITIVGGEYSDAVCKKLKKAGVIDDVEAFNKYLSKKGYDNLIQPGTYVIPLGADYATVAKLITDKENRKEEKK
ncbi:MAG: hypothetical protein SPE81_06510 [Agathobacter sp.]|nr:hypothetical protein [Agathobacter sp.]